MFSDVTGSYNGWIIVNELAYKDSLVGLADLSASSDLRLCLVGILAYSCL